MTGSDLMLLQRLGEGLAPPPGGAPADLRRRVMTGVLSDRTRARRTRVAWRLALGGALTAVVAAATAVVIGLTTPGGSTAVVRNPGNAPPSTGDVPPTDRLDGAQVLRFAARRAAASPELTARPDQFIFVEDVWVVHGRDAPIREQRWLSAESALRTDLPTDAAAMRAYLYRPERERVRTATGEYEYVEPADATADEIAWDRVAELVRTTYSPAVHAAAFEVASTIAGVVVDESATDVAGRSGIAVTYGATLIRTELLFDPVGYAFMGQKGVVVQTGEAGTVLEGLSPGTVFRGRAVLRVAVVDEVGRLP